MVFFLVFSSVPHLLLTLLTLSSEWWAIFNFPSIVSPSNPCQGFWFLNNNFLLTSLIIMIFYDLKPKTTQRDHQFTLFLLFTLFEACKKNTFAWKFNASGQKFLIQLNGDFSVENFFFILGIAARNIFCVTLPLIRGFRSNQKLVITTIHPSSFAHYCVVYNLGSLDGVSGSP